MQRETAVVAYEKHNKAARCKRRTGGIQKLAGYVESDSCRLMWVPSDGVGQGYCAKNMLVTKCRMFGKGLR